MMKSVCRVLFSLLAVALVAGCASTTVTTPQSPMVNAGMARPSRIWVYNFVADPADMPANSSIASAISRSRTPPTASQIAEGRQLGALIAADLVGNINGMGLIAVQAGPGASPQVGDGVIRGYLVSVQGGGAAKRFIIGFGYGTSEMDTVVEGYSVTAQGWQKLGSGTLSSSGSKTPGMIMPAAVAIASGNPLGLIVVGGLKVYGEASGKNTLQGRARDTADAISDELKIRFQDRGWIQ
jgi:hypothetical protein